MQHTNATPTNLEGMMKVAYYESGRFWIQDGYHTITALGRGLYEVSFYFGETLVDTVRVRNFSYKLSMAWL